MTYLIVANRPSPRRKVLWRELFTRAPFLIGLLIGQGHKQVDYSLFGMGMQRDDAERLECGES